jgi:hypothetical protein
MVAANVASYRRVHQGALNEEDVRFAALFVALFTIFVGIGGLISPESGTEIRRLYFATPVRLFTAGAVRVAMGLVVILSAPDSCAPKTLRALVAVMCMQGLAATLMGKSFLNPVRAGAYRPANTSTAAFTSAGRRSAAGHDQRPSSAPAFSRTRALRIFFTIPIGSGLTGEK